MEKHCNCLGTADQALKLDNLLKNAKTKTDPAEARVVFEPNTHTDSFIFIYNRIVILNTKYCNG